MKEAVEPKPSGTVPTDIEQVFRDHHDLVYRTAYRITGSAMDAEDALQTLFLRLVRREEPLDLRGNPQAYLHRAAVNISLDIVRARGRSAPIGEMDLWIEETRPNPGQQHAASELGKWLRRAISELSPRAAEVFVLRHVEGYSNPEIARMLRTSVGAVAVNLFKARIRLQKSFRSYQEKSDESQRHETA